MVLKMARVAWSLVLMDQLIQDILNKINFKDKDSYLYHRELTKEILEMVKWKEKEYLGLKMEPYMMGNIKKIGNMDLVNLLRMGKLMRGDGRMGWDKVRDF